MNKRAIAMFAWIKSIIERVMIYSHHIGNALTGVFAFGFVAYLLDIGGFRTQALSHGGVHGPALTFIGSVIAVFLALNVAMKRLMGKHGVF
ncbi:MAG: hypothetical protein WAW96_12155 [Alphaproteobacteria bacterium]